MGFCSDQTAPGIPELAWPGMQSFTGSRQVCQSDWKHEIKGKTQNQGYFKGQRWAVTTKMQHQEQRRSTEGERCTSVYLYTFINIYNLHPASFLKPNHCRGTVEGTILVAAQNLVMLWGAVREGRDGWTLNTLLIKQGANWNLDGLDNSQSPADACPLPEQRDCLLPWSSTLMDLTPPNSKPGKLHFHRLHFQQHLGSLNSAEFFIPSIQSKETNTSSLPSRNSHFPLWLRTTHVRPQLLELLHKTFWVWYLWVTLGIRGTLMLMALFYGDLSLSWGTENFYFPNEQNAVSQCLSWSGPGGCDTSGIAAGMLGLTGH